MTKDDGWRCLWEAKAHIGESTIWDERDGCIYWVDIAAPTVNWYHLASGTKRTWIPPVWISALAIRAQGGFIASTATGFAYVDPAAGRLENFLDPRTQPKVTRLNDGVTDLKGRYWSGSCDNRQFDDTVEAEDKNATAQNFDVRDTGELFRLDPSGAATLVESKIVTSNGPAFSPDGKTMYFNDSLPRVTWAYDLAADGTISNRRDFLKFDESHGFPDGMAVDVEGCLWICFCESWEMRRYSPAAVLMEERKLPVRWGLRPAFGGENYARLFVMAGTLGSTEKQPLAGSLFEILDPGVRGLPNTPYKG